MQFGGSSRNAGIYALGRVTTNPAKKPLNFNQIKYFVDKDYVVKFEEKHSSYLEYIKRSLEKPFIALDDCNRESALSGLQVFMNPQHTNFRLTYEQWERIQELASKKEELV